MRRTLRPLELELVLLIGMVTGACTGATEPSITLGGVEITVTTSGSATDTNGYGISLDGTPASTGAAEFTVLLPDLIPGPHQIALTDVATACEVPGNPRQVDVPAGGKVTVKFDVTCVGRASLRVITHTTGEPTDSDGYVVSLPSTGDRAIGANDTLELTDVPAVGQMLHLTGVAANCVAAGGFDRYLTPPAGSLTPVTFEITCAPISHTPGKILISVSTQLINVAAPISYTVVLDGSRTVPISAGHGTFADVPPGSHDVFLDGPGYCAVGGLFGPHTNPVSLTLAPGQTLTLTFHVLCIG